jgi:hypothetical protein
MIWREEREEAYDSTRLQFHVYWMSGSYGVLSEAKVDEEDIANQSIKQLNNGRWLVL